MTKRWLFGVELCAFLGCLGGGTFPRFVNAQSCDAQLNRTAGQIMAIQGEVNLKPKGSQKYVPARLGTLFRRGDLLQVAASAQATVVCCANLKKYDLPHGFHGLPCPPSNDNTSAHNNSVVMKTRGDNLNPGFPVILSPRSTKLLNAHPTLRWTPVTGATTYQVIVRGRNLDWSTETSSKTELVYPTDAPALVAGEIYTLTVVAGNRSSEKEKQPGLGFTILKSDQAQAVREVEEKIRKLGLPDSSMRFLIIQHYAMAGLNAEAIEQSKELSTTTDEPAAARQLGELYLNIGLNRLAEEQYLRALELAEKTQDVRGQALAQHALGQIYYEAIGNNGEARKCWQKARDLYRRLGDAGMVKQIQVALARLP